MEPSNGDDDTDQEQRRPERAYTIVVCDTGLVREFVHKRSILKRVDPPDLDRVRNIENKLGMYFLRYNVEKQVWILNPAFVGPRGNEIDSTLFI